MSNIIKSFAVVDDREQDIPVSFAFAGAERPVIKSRAIKGGAPRPLSSLFPAKETYLDELNRIRVDVEDAKAELRKISSQLLDGKEELERLKERRKKLEDLSDLDVNQQAQRILEDAEEEARRIVEEIDRDNDAHRQQAIEEGYAEGLRQGIAKAEEDFKALHQPEVDKLAELLRSVSNVKGDIVAESEAELIELIVAITDRVIGRHIQQDPKLLVDMLRREVEENRRESFIKIRISDSLLPLEEPLSEGICVMIADLCERIDVAIDTNLPDRGIVVETPNSYNDLTIPVQMNNMKGELLDQLQSE